MSEGRLNPLLEAVRIPGETFRLPSGGIFYTNNELADGVKDSEIVVNPMTARHELLMKSPDKLFSGDAIRTVISECVPQVEKPGELLSNDVDFLLMCLRAVSYGNDLEITVKHTCEEAKEHSYVVNVREIIQSAKSVDPTAISKNFKLTIENGQVITLRPPTFDSTIGLYQAMDNSELGEEKSEEEFLDAMFRALSEMIENVDGIDDKEMIYEWLSAIKPGWVKQISDKVETLSQWGIEKIIERECKDCGEAITIEVPANPISFFT